MAGVRLCPTACPTSRDFPMVSQIGLESQCACRGFESLLRHCDKAISFRFLVRIARRNRACACPRLVTNTCSHDMACPHGEVALATAGLPLVVLGGSRGGTARLSGRGDLASWSSRTIREWQRLRPRAARRCLEARRLAAPLCSRVRRSTRLASPGASRRTACRSPAGVRLQLEVLEQAAG
jgi:hypothetical protein